MVLQPPEATEGAAPMQTEDAPPTPKSKVSSEVAAGIRKLIEANKGKVPTPQPEASEAPEKAEEEDAPTQEVETEGLESKPPRYAVIPGQEGSVFATPEHRKIVEDRCEAMVVDDLIINDEARQKVIILPGKLEVVFRTQNGGEEFYIKERVFKESQELSVTHSMELFALFNLAACLVSIGEKTFPSHLDESGVLVAELFDRKLVGLKRRPSVLLGALSVNLGWFMERAQELFKPEKLKNG